MPERVAPQATWPSALERWLSALESRHLADMRFSDVARALRALSSTYVERRSRLAEKGSLDSPGKRAAFALFYAPLHLLLVRAVVGALDEADSVRQILDLGCGTGAAGAGWASACVTPPRVVGLDRHPWTLPEAALTYRTFALDGEALAADVTRFRVPRGTDAIVAAFVANELDEANRSTLLTRLIESAKGGVRVLVVEPLATRVAPWWPEWVTAVEKDGGRADTWRIPVVLPDLVSRLDRAAGLRHAELTARSLWIHNRNLRS